MTMLSITKRLKNLNLEDSTAGKMKKEFSLYKYQKKVIKWMRIQESKKVNGISGGLICLTMGLGKTLIALYHAIRYREKYPDKEQFPTLIVLSKTLLYEWKNQGVEKFFDNVLAFYYHKDFIGKQAFDNITTDELMRYDLVFTTYDTCLTIYKKYNYEDVICLKGDAGIHKDKVILINNRKRPRFTDHYGPKALYEIPWSRLYCDESQRFANPTTQTFRAVMAIYADHKWCLSGSPIKNYESDIWAQLRFCGFDKIVHARKWKRHCYKLHNCHKHIYVLNYEQANVNMPDKREKVYYIDMDEKQETLYATILKKLTNVFGEFLAKKGVSYIYVLAMFTRLRQVCISPHLVITNRTTNKEVLQTMNEIFGTEDHKKWLLNRHGTSGIKSPKIVQAVKIIKELQEQKEPEKVIVFSMFVTSLEILELALEKEGICSVMMIGKTSVKDRVNNMKIFKESTKCNVMLIHYKVGGEGINLTEATHVIPLEPWWTHAVHNQGIHRAWRRGQTNPVTVHWLLVNKSIEHRILEMCNDKFEMANSYLHDYEEYSENTGIDMYGMRKVIYEMSNHEKMVKEVRDWASDKDIVTLLAELGFTGDNVSKMYKQCILKIHPDKVSASERERSTEIFKVVNEAYNRYKDQ